MRTDRTHATTKHTTNIYFHLTKWLSWVGNRIHNRLSCEAHSICVLSKKASICENEIWNTNFRGVLFLSHYVRVPTNFIEIRLSRCGVLNLNFCKGGKRAKGPAPGLPLPERREVKLHMTPEELQVQLDLLETQQLGLERQGVLIERMIRDKCEGKHIRCTLLVYIARAFYL